MIIIKYYKALLYSLLQCAHYLKMTDFNESCDPTRSNQCGADLVCELKNHENKCVHAIY